MPCSSASLCLKSKKHNYEKKKPVRSRGKVSWHFFDSGSLVFEYQRE